MIRKPDHDPYENDSFPRLMVVWGLPVLLLAGLIIVYFSEPGTKGLLPCTFYQLTGIYCTGCGATRAVHSLLHGKFIDALRYNLFFLIWIWPVAYLILAYWLRRLFYRPILPSFKVNKHLIILAIITSLAFFVLRNIKVAPFTWLAPP